MGKVLRVNGEEIFNKKNRKDNNLNMKMKKTSQFLIITFFISFSFLFQVSCGKYSAYDYLTGKVENDKKLIEDENKAKIDAENKVKADTKAKLDSENKLKSDTQAKLDTENKLKSDEQTKLDAQTKKQIEGMVFVEGGFFNMQEKQITLSSFYISKYETNQSEYQSIMGKNPSYFKGSNLPVEYVSWFDAIKYCNAKSKKEGLSVAYNETTGELLDSVGSVTSDITKVMGYRLPTEAEWEFAAKGGNKSKGYTYIGSSNAEEIAWFSLNSEGKTHEVGTKKSNELGLYDMSGNVWEWCTDWYDSNYYNNSSNINPVNTNNSDVRVVRGASWLNNPNYLRLNLRYNSVPSINNLDLGFRIAKTTPFN